MAMTSERLAELAVESGRLQSAGDRVFDVHTLEELLSKLDEKAAKHTLSDALVLSGNDCRMIAELVRAELVFIRKVSAVDSMTELLETVNVLEAEIATHYNPTAWVEVLDHLKSAGLRPWRRVSEVLEFIDDLAVRAISQPDLSYDVTKLPGYYSHLPMLTVFHDAVSGRTAIARNLSGYGWGWVPLGYAIGAGFGGDREAAERAASAWVKGGE